jgi:hypothetical protein
MADTVTLEIEVEVPGATEEQVAMYRDMADIFEQRFQTFVEKNLDYGSSFLTAGEVDMALGGGEGPFDTMREANLYKLFTRIQDKNQRFYQQAFCGGDNLVGEDLAETAGDAMVYWAMVNWLVMQDQ